MAKTPRIILRKVRVTWTIKCPCGRRFVVRPGQKKRCTCGRIYKC